MEDLYSTLKEEKQLNIVVRWRFSWAGAAVLFESEMKPFPKKDKECGSF